MRKIVITYGLIAGAISALLWTTIALLMKNSTDFSHSMLLGYTSMLLSIFIVYFAMANYRDRINGGEITFGKAFLIGLYISIIYAVLYVVVWMIIRQTLLPDFVDKFVAWETEQLQKANLSAEEFNQKMQELEQTMSVFSNPWKEAMFVFMEPWPVAILVTLVSAFIVSRKKRREAPAA